MSETQAILPRPGLKPGDRRQTRLMSSIVAPLNEAVAAGQKAAVVDTAMIARITAMAGDFAINLSVALIILIVTVFAARWAAGA